MTEGFLRARLAIADREVTFEARGFQPAERQKQLRLEGIGRTFVRGYHDALECRGPKLACRLEEVVADDRGFAYEGAAMALALQDAMIPFARRLATWIAGPANRHEYMTYVGAGWAIARLPWQRMRAERCARALHSFLWPLVLDGLGFHQAYFHAAKPDTISNPRGIHTAQGRSAYDQGLGRAFWFLCGADPWKVAERIGTYEHSRRLDLWAGAGLACAYAGGVSAEEARILLRLAGCYVPAAAQGACFAAKARIRAGNLTPHTELACQVLCGMSAREAACLSDEVHSIVIGSGGDYRDWSQLIQSKLKASAFQESEV